MHRGICSEVLSQIWVKCMAILQVSHEGSITFPLNNLLFDIHEIQDMYP